ncbi:hypothetical protein ACFWN1_26195 [Streptomyces sp. NPDC058459]|uniref:hypothetical protein n=1 Tax=Streptomyces sp. NPDC058459 TaxID=3346508 RepID=UPI00364FE7B6
MFDASPPHGPTRAPEPTPERPAGERDSFFDNAEYLAVVLAAMGHSWEALYPDSRILRALCSAARWS